MDTNTTEIRTPSTNADGAIGNWLRRARTEKAYQILCTMTTPAAKTKSIGLQADALLSWFLQCHLDKSP
jgi:hypothetical protein